MRCLESFVHLCAVGMFDDCEINILTIDTDQSNGNKSRTENLIKIYNEIRGNHKISKDCFFTAKLNLHAYTPNYAKDGRRTFTALCDTSSRRTIDNKELADLFFDSNSHQKLDLTHGYRAQTHLGTFLLYHSLLESIIQVQKDEEKCLENDKVIHKYFEEINKSTTGSSKKVFVFGSIFGGTGASAIPIIPKVVEKAGSLKTLGTPTEIFYGATILSNYFEFKAPSDDQKRKDVIVADSHFFPLNSHAALQFYANDATIKKKYNALYQLGWPKKRLRVGSEQKTITGGKDQKNDSHILELFAAFAAHHFFESKQEAGGETKYLHKEVQDIDKFTFRDLSGEKYYIAFEKKITALFAIGILLLVTEEGLESDENGINSLIEKLKGKVLKPNFFVEDEQLRQIHKYFKLFLFDADTNTLLPGWLYQIKESVGDGSKFLFKDEVFIRDGDGMDIIVRLLPQLKRPWWMMVSDPFDTFITELLKAKPDDETSQLGTLLKILYNTTIKLQNP